MSPFHRRAKSLRRGRAGVLVILVLTAFVSGARAVPPPLIVLQPQSQTVVAGGGVTFSVGLGGSGTFSYQWRFNSTNLAGSTNQSLTLTNVQPSQQGYYSVIVRSTGGSTTSSNALLTVLVPPYIITAPANRNVRIGDTAVVTVMAGGTEPLNYRWRFNGRELPGENARSLVISNAQPVNAGRYQVAVSNLVGSIASPDAALLVTTTTGFILAPLGLTGSLQTNNFNSPSQLEMICQVPAGGPVWLGLEPVEDGGLLVLDTAGSGIGTVLSVYLGTKTGNLKLIACDNGGAPGGKESALRVPALRNVDYLIRVDGSNGVRGAVQLNWKFGMPPALVAAPRSQTAVVGDSVTFAAAATGVPEPAFQWRFNGQAISRATNAAFTLAHVALSDAGDYSVEARNFAGSVLSTNAALTIFPPLRFLSPKLKADGFHLLLTGPPGTYWIEVSRDLVQWETVGHIDATKGAAEFIDPIFKIPGRRFYRATRF